MATIKQFPQLSPIYEDEPSTSQEPDSSYALIPRYSSGRYSLVKVVEKSPVSVDLPMLLALNIPETRDRTYTLIAISKKLNQMGFLNTALKIFNILKDELLKIGAQKAQGFAESLTLFGFTVFFPDALISAPETTSLECSQSIEACLSHHNSIQAIVNAIEYYREDDQSRDQLFTVVNNIGAMGSGSTDEKAFLIIKDIFKLISSRKVGVSNLLMMTLYSIATDLVSSQIETGDLEKAMNNFQSIKNDRGAVEKVGKTLLKTNIDKSIEFLRANTFNIHLLFLIADELIQRNEHDRAVTLLDEYENNVNELYQKNKHIIETTPVDDLPGGTALIPEALIKHFAVLYVEAHRIEKALSMVEKTLQGDDFVSALALLACVMIKENPHEAFKLVPQIFRSNIPRYESFVELAAGLVREGRIDNPFEFFETYLSHTLSLYSFQDFLLACIEKDKLNDAAKIHAALSTTGRDDVTAKAIIQKLIQKELPQKAVWAALFLEKDTIERKRELAFIVTKVVELGGLEATLQFIEQLNDPNDRATAYIQIAIEMIKQGQMEKAYGLINEHFEAALQERIYLQIGIALLIEGKLEQVLALATHVSATFHEKLEKVFFTLLEKEGIDSSRILSKLALRLVGSGSDTCPTDVKITKMLLDEIPLSDSLPEFVPPAIVIEVLAKVSGMVTQGKLEEMSTIVAALDTPHQQWIYYQIAAELLAAGQLAQLGAFAKHCPPVLLPFLEKALADVFERKDIDSFARFTIMEEIDSLAAITEGVQKMKWDEQH